MIWEMYLLGIDDIDVNGGTWKPEYDQAFHGQLLIERGVRKVLKALSIWKPSKPNGETC